MEGGSDCAVAFRKAHDPNFPEPREARLLQKFSNSEADPSMARRPRDTAQEWEPL